MNIASTPQILRATFLREHQSQRSNRFLYWHVALQLVTGVLALIAPPEVAARGAAWWVLQAVLFAGSLSALMLGLSSAQAETEELPLLQTQPWRIRWWVTGKAAALLSIIFPSSLLLVIPAGLAQGWSVSLSATALSAASVMAVLAWMGLALGLWIRDAIRALIAGIALWLCLLIAPNLVLLLLAGTSWVERVPDLWVMPLMLSPLDVYRVTVLFSVERAAFTGLDQGRLASWWLANAPAWLALCLCGWAALAHAAAIAGANRRSDT